MTSLREMRIAAKNLLLLARVFCRRHSRDVWNVHFDRTEYLALNRDVERSRYPAVLHYLIWGNRDLRDPSSRFDTRFYLARHPDVARAGLNALAHFAAFGQIEGRLIPGMFRNGPGKRPAVRITNVPWPSTLPLVTIVIPCYNYGEFIEFALQSGVDQTLAGVEIIVVEGGSDDGSTRQKVRELEASGTPGVRFLYREERHLAGDNRNFGIRAAQSRYICCLDADDRLDAIYVEVAVFLAETAGYALVYPSVRRLGTEEPLWSVKDTTLDQMLYHNDIPSCALFRRDDWELVGGYRDWGLGDRHVTEDWDFWIRIMGLGRSTRAIAEPLMEYRVHGAGLTGQSSPILEQQRAILQAANSPLMEFRPAVSDAARVEAPLLNLGRSADQPKSVLFALPFLTFGGAESLFRKVAGWANEVGWMPQIITTLELPPEVPKDPACFEGITKRVYPLPTLFRTHQERLAFVGYLIRRYRVELLILGGSEAMYHWLPEIKAVYPGLFVADHLFNSDAHAYNNHHYRDYIDATVVQSDRVIEEIQQRFGEPAGEVWRIPLGIELPGAIPDHESTQDAQVIGYFGRLSHEKGPDLFVQIAKKLVKTNPGTRFIIAGDGPEKETVRELVRASGLDSVFEMPGHVKQIFSLMKKTDIVVLPSRIDGMPATVLEAQALGIPVVASRVGGLPEIIDDGNTGYLCPAGSIEAFCDRLSFLIRDPQLRRRIGGNARRSVEAKHSVEEMKDRYLELMEHASCPRIRADIPLPTTDGRQS